jgi:hypothetical protein
MSGLSDLEPWDNGYPSGGNFWSDYTAKYSNASLIEDSGIWNTSYVISERLGLVDRYPLYNPYEIYVSTLPTPPPNEIVEDSPTPSVPEFPICTAALLLAVILCFAVIYRKRLIGKPMGNVYA